MSSITTNLLATQEKPRGAASLPGRLQRRSPAEEGRWITYALLTMGALCMLVPFISMLSSSLKTNPEIQRVPPTILPRTFQWHNYPESLGKDKLDLWRTFPNTVVVTALCVAGQIISSSLVGFGFARFRFRGRNVMFLIMLSTMMLPYQVTMIPQFLLYRGLGWIDTFLPLIVPAWLGGPFFVFMFRQFFLAVPEELLEAARIDGASSFRIYWNIMMPLTGPVVVITAIYTFVSTWNDFLGPLIYLDSPSNRTLSLALASFNSQYGISQVNQLMAASCITMIPCLLLFAVSQRYFVESIGMTGGKS